MKRFFIPGGILGLAAAPVAVGLALHGVLPDRWAVAALLAWPVVCVSLTVGANSGTNAGVDTPPLMQTFAGGGGC